MSFPVRYPFTSSIMPCPSLLIFICTFVLGVFVFDQDIKAEFRDERLSVLQGVKVAEAYDKVKERNGSLEDFASLIVALQGLPELPQGESVDGTMIGFAGLLAKKFIQDNYVKNVAAFKHIMASMGFDDEAVLKHMVGVHMVCVMATDLSNICCLAGFSQVVAPEDGGLCSRCDVRQCFWPGGQGRTLQM